MIERVRHQTVAIVTASLQFNTPQPAPTQPQVENQQPTIEQPQIETTQPTPAQSQIETQQQMQPQVAPTVEAPVDPYENLVKLKKLADQGVISQEEFEKAKAKLLGI